MDLLIASNTVTLDQADKAPASGTPGWATDGDPATGQLATDAPAWHYNMMMSELIAIIKAAGITPSNADWSQVLKAMQTIFSPAQYGVSPYSASLAQLIGGYPKGAIVFDASGNYWQSTAEKNVTVPGTENATWVNFFEGVMTPQQGDIRYLQLSGGNVTGPMDWGNTTAAGTVTQRFWCAGKPDDGDATPDGTLTISGGTAGTANKGVMALSTGTFDLTGVGSILVPDVEDFTSQEVLSAKTAEDRYISSVADAAASLKRIISLLENADGRAVFGDGTNNSVLANLSDLPTQFNGVDSSGRGYGYQKFNDGTMIVFGYAYYQKSTDTTGTVVTLPFSFPGKFIGLNCTDVGNNNNAVGAYPESQSSFRCWGGAPTFSYLNTEFYYSARGTWK